MCIGVSGDGDSASIGLGQFAHVVHRRTIMLYLVHNNGNCGLTEGQFSAINDKGSTGKKSIANPYDPIDLVSMALQLGAGFVVRSFSGDKRQLVPLIKAALKRKGMAFIYVVSACAAFNNHSGSTNSFEFMHEYSHNLVDADLIFGQPELTSDYAKGTHESVDMRDGSVLHLYKVDADCHPCDRIGALTYVQKMH